MRRPSRCVVGEFALEGKKQSYPSLEMCVCVRLPINHAANLRYVPSVVMIPLCAIQKRLGHCLCSRAVKKHRRWRHVLQGVNSSKFDHLHVSRVPHLPPNASLPAPTRFVVATGFFFNLLDIDQKGRRQQKRSQTFTSAFRPIITATRSTLN